MILLQDKKLDSLEKCSYIPENNKRFEYFFAQKVSKEEISLLLANGWRKFGAYYFRPRCPACKACIPLRVLTSSFSPSRSQRRIIKKNQDIDVKFTPLIFQPKIYELYRNHSENRFGNKKNSLEDFMYSFYYPSCPALQSEFYLEGELVAVGFLDLGIDCLSSVYFVYDTVYQNRNLGTFSILKEIEYANSLKLPYYYLGYYIEKCSRMVYKDKFCPRQHYNWQKNIWETL